MKTAFSFTMQELSNILLDHVDLNELIPSDKTFDTQISLIVTEKPEDSLVAIVLEEVSDSE